MFYLLGKDVFYVFERLRGFVIMAIVVVLFYFVIRFARIRHWQ